MMFSFEPNEDKCVQICGFAVVRSVCEGKCHRCSHGKTMNFLMFHFVFSKSSEIYLFQFFKTVYKNLQPKNDGDKRLSHCVEILKKHEIVKKTKTRRTGSLNASLNQISLETLNVD